MATEGSALCGMPPPASLGDDRMTICESNAAIMTCNSSEAKHMVRFGSLPALTLFKFVDQHLQMHCRLREPLPSYRQWPMVGALALRPNL